MVQKKHKVSKVNHGKFENDPHLSEKIVLLLFLIFVVMSVAILLTGLPTTFTSLATGGLNLQGNQYAGNEQLKGNFVFSLDSRDVLPTNSTFVFSILTNASKCALKYSCSPSTSSPVDWYAINSTTGACNIIEPDPEGECCLKQGDKCPQVILNKDFNDGTNKWTANAGKTIINTETLRWDEGENEIASVVMFQDGSKFNGGNYNFSLSQLFDARKIQMYIHPPCKDSDEIRGADAIYFKGNCEDENSFDNDTCINGTIVKEWQCVGSGAGEGKICASQQIWCPAGFNCSNGACMEEIPLMNTCKDSDGGIVLDRKGTVLMNYTNGTNFTYTDFCTEDTGSSHTVKEFYCQNMSAMNATKRNCSLNGICTNGACPSNTQEETATPATFSSRPGASGNASIYDININWSFGYQIIEDDEMNTLEPCAFEIIVSSNTSRSLHYYYPLATTDMYGCNDPLVESATDKYMNLKAYNPSASDPSQNIIVLAKDSRSLINDWQTKFGTNTKNDYVNEIKVISKKRTGLVNGVMTTFGQRVFVEYVNLFSNSTPAEINCTRTGKKCCLTGTGFGTYYGKQLNCSTDYECWSSCSDTQTLKLTQLIAKSNNYDKKNRTSDECQAWVNGVKIPADGLHDQCYESISIVRKGYTLAYDENGQPVSYTLDLTSITLRAPNQNGTYSLKVRYQYSPVSYPCYDAEGNALSSCLIFENLAPFIVGDGGQGGGCSSSWINITPWGECINNVQRRTMHDSNGCNPDYNATQPCGCSVVWGNCAWQPCQGTNQDKLCQDTTCGTGITNVTETRACCTEDWQASEGDCIDGLKTITYSDASACGTTFNKPNDDTITCQEKKGGSIFSSWIIWVIIVVILLGVFVFVLLSVLKKKPKKVVGGRSETRTSTSSGSSSGGESSEIVSYINEAVASGLSKEDIKAKLSEAGWPDDVIEKSFLDAGI